jgi:hypothetical protein
MYKRSGPVNNKRGHRYGCAGIPALTLMKRDAGPCGRAAQNSQGGNRRRAHQALLSDFFALAPADATIVCSRRRVYRPRAGEKQ